MYPFYRFGLVHMCNTPHTYALACYQGPMQIDAIGGEMDVALTHCCDIGQ